MAWNAAAVKAMTKVYSKVYAGALQHVEVVAYARLIYDLFSLP